MMSKTWPKFCKLPQGFSHWIPTMGFIPQTLHVAAVLIWASALHAEKVTFSENLHPLFL